jgi:hypothetical protein
LNARALAALLALALIAGCASISVTSPNGCASATLKTWTLLGTSDVTCQDEPPNGTTSALAGCTIAAQNAQQLISTVTAGVMGALTQAGVFSAVAGKQPPLRAVPAENQRCFAPMPVAAPTPAVLPTPAPAAS